MSRALAAYDPCGCCAVISVLDGYEADAYAMAGREAKAGRRIENVDVAEWKRHPLFCADHPKGPPWWKSNGGNGRVPAIYESQLSLPTGAVVG